MTCLAFTAVRNFLQIRVLVPIVLTLTMGVAGAYDITVSGRMAPTVKTHEYSLDVRIGQKLIFHFDGDGPL